MEMWNDHFPFPAVEERVRQFLSPSDLAADLRRRDGHRETTADSEGEEDDTSLVSQDSLVSEGMVVEVLDNHGQSISVRFRVDREGNFVEGKFDGDFKDVFRRLGNP